MKKTKANKHLNVFFIVTVVILLAVLVGYGYTTYSNNMEKKNKEIIRLQAEQQKSKDALEAERQAKFKAELKDIGDDYEKDKQQTTVEPAPVYTPRQSFSCSSSNIGSSTYTNCY